MARDALRATALDNAPTALKLTHERLKGEQFEANRDIFPQLGVADLRVIEDRIIALTALKT